MNLATWSIRNPVPAILLFGLLSVAGVWGLKQLPIQDLPDIDLPTVMITLSQPGATPAQLETDVARKVENSLASLTGLKHIRTSITDGQVVLTVEFALERKLAEALADAKGAVDGVRSDLPSDVLPPAVSAVTTARSATLTYAIAALQWDEEALSWFVDDTVAKRLLAVPGVGRVERVGGAQREVRVDLDPVRLAALNATAGDVSRALRGAQQHYSGGRGQLGQGEQAVRIVNAAGQADELGGLPMVLADGRRLRLDEVATVNDSVAERGQMALLDGRSAIGFKVFRAKGFDETRIAQRVQQELEQLVANEPTLTVTPISSTATRTQEQFDGSMTMLLEGAALTILVVWLFLRDWRATLVAAAALPLSILPTFAAMHLFGFSLNLVTLLALAVVVGVLVDDAIVEVENIERHSRMGKPMHQAAGDAVTEIALAVIATTLTLVAVFLPTAFMSGVPGLFFSQFGWTAAVAVLASLLVARVVTPIMAVWLLRPRSVVERPDGRTMRWYLQAVRWCLANRAATLVLAAAFFAGSLALATLLPTGLVPAADRGYTSVGIELPPGNSLQDTLLVSENVRTALKGIDGIQRVFTVVGAPQRGGGTGQSKVGDVATGTMTLTLADRDERPNQTMIENAVRQSLLAVPGARFTVGNDAASGEKFSLLLASDNVTAMKASAEALTTQLRGIAGLSGISSTAGMERPEITVTPDVNRAAELGVAMANIGEVVRIATVGDFDSQLAKLNLENRQIGIRVRMLDPIRQDLDALGSLRVNARDNLVPLSSVATLSLDSGLSRIDRYDRRRFVTISADLGGLSLGRVQKSAHALPAIEALPRDVQLLKTGDSEIQSELFSGFGIAIFVGLVSVFCVLVLLFHSFLLPVAILSAIPLSLGGAVVALLLARSELDLPSMIGLVMLTGIVTKNSILLVEFASVSQRTLGISLHDAVIDACHKRARPIVMTTVAMIAGMLPIGLGFGADASFRQPMAVAVIGGLITSTALSLVVVPVAIVCIDGLSRWLRRATGTEKETPPGPRPSIG